MPIGPSIYGDSPKIMGVGDDLEKVVSPSIAKHVYPAYTVHYGRTKDPYFLQQPSTVQIESPLTPADILDSIDMLISY